MAEEINHFYMFSMPTVYAIIIDSRNKDMIN